MPAPAFITVKVWPTVIPGPAPGAVQICGKSMQLRGRARAGEREVELAGELTRASIGIVGGEDQLPLRGRPGRRG